MRTALAVIAGLLWADVLPADWPITSAIFGLSLGVWLFTPFDVIVTKAKQRIDERQKTGENHEVP